MEFTILNHTFDLVDVLSVGGTFLLTVVPSIISSIAKSKKIKNLKQSNTEASNENVLSEVIQGLIIDAEKTFARVNAKLKVDGTGAGETKKAVVLSNLSDYCSENGIDFDKEKWSEKIDEIIDLTKKVNK